MEACPVQLKTNSNRHKPRQASRRQARASWCRQTDPRQRGSEAAPKTLTPTGLWRVAAGPPQPSTGPAVTWVWFEPRLLPNLPLVISAHSDPSLSCLTLQWVDHCATSEHTFHTQQARSPVQPGLLTCSFQ